MRTLGAILEHPEELDLLMELVTTAMRDPKHIPPQPHWRFCYSMFRKFSLAVFLVLQELDPSLRDVICVLSLALKALDTIEDDTSIPTDVKVPILNDFHLHIYDREWHFSCGTKKCKALMDDFHYVSTAFLELDECYQDVIKDTIKKMGAGMAKFICEEVETIDDYDEYCHYVAGVIAQAISKLSHACGLEDLAPDNLSNSVGLFIQKCDIIQDYSEDINAMPKPRMFWPRHIWSKYVNKLEELKYEENSVKALQCLNDMVTNALVHVEDCFKYISALKDPSIFRLWALLLTADMGILTLCYNNSEVFRGVVKLRPGVLARIFYQTRSIDDVYHNFFDFTCTLKSKVDESDPNAARTLSILEAIQNICREFGQINKRKSYMLGNKWKYKFIMILLGFIVLSIALANLSAK